MDCPLTKAELKTVTLLLRNARDTCEVIEYIGELKLLEAASLRRHLGTLKEWLVRIEELAGWQGELDVDLELFAADLELVHGAYELRLKLELEEYTSWFGKSAFHIMPRFMGRLSRLCASLTKLKQYTREAHDEIPVPTPPPSPAPVVEVAALDEDEPACLHLTRDTASSPSPSTVAIDGEEAPTVEDAQRRMEAAEKQALPYLPEMGSDGFRALPHGMFSNGDVVRLEQAKVDLQAASLAGQQGRKSDAMSAASRAENVLRELYDHSAPLARAALADLYACCLGEHAVADGGSEKLERWRAVDETHMAIFREALDCHPNDILLQERLAGSLVNFLSTVPITDLAGFEAEASLAVRLLKGVRAYFDGHRSFGPSATIEARGTSQIQKALLYYGLSVHKTTRAAAEAAWEEGVGYLAAADERSGLDSSQMLIGIELHSQLAALYGESREWTLMLQRARLGLELCKRQVKPHDLSDLRRQQTEALRTVCWKLLPEEEKRLIKVVNIRKLQAKTRSIGCKKDSEADKALMAAAVAELADLRAFKKALKEGKL